MTEQQPAAARALFHININVSDLERSIAFYEQLGFRLIGDHRAVEWGDTGIVLGHPGAQGRSVLLMLGDDQRATRLDLIEWTNPPSPPREALRVYDLGVPRIALWARDVDALYESLRATGVEFVSAPLGPFEEGGVDRVVCCKDPDGLIVDLIQFARGARARAPEGGEAG